MKKLQTFWNLSLTEKIMFFKAFFLSAFIRFVTFYLPMRWWYRVFMGEQTETICNTRDFRFTLKEKLELHKIHQMIRLACRYAPWEAKCLVESILLKKLVKNNSLPIYLGLNKIEDKYFAHAWINAGKQIKNEYKVVSVHV